MPTNTDQSLRRKPRFAWFGMELRTWTFIFGGLLALRIGMWVMRRLGWFDGS